MITNRFTLALGIGLYFLVTVSAVLQQVVLVPVFSTYWSDDLYSSWLIMFSVGTLLIVADFGLNPLTYNRLQAELAQGERGSRERLKHAVANSFFAYRFVFVAILAGAPLVAFALPVPHVLGLVGAPEWEMRLAFLITLVGSAMTIPIVGLSAVLRVTNRINSMSTIRICTAVIAMTLMYLAISRGLGIVGVASGYAAANTFEMLVMLLVLTPRALPEFRSVRTTMRVETVRDTLARARKFLIPVSADILIQSIPTFLMGIIGTASVGVVVYTLARVVTSCVRQVAIAVMFAFSSSIGYAWTQSNLHKAANVIATCLAVVGAGTGAACGYFWSYHVALVDIWTGGVYQADSVVFALLFAGIISAGPGIVAWHALLFIGAPTAVTKAKSLQIIVLCLLCVAAGIAFGVRGVAASVLLSELVVVSVPLALELLRRFPIGGRRFFTSATVPTVGMFLLSYWCAEAAQRLRPPVNVWTFGTSSALWIPVPLAAGLLVFYLSTRGIGRDQRQMTS